MYTVESQHVGSWMLEDHPKFEATHRKLDSQPLPRPSQKGAVCNHRQPEAGICYLLFICHSLRHCEF